MVSKATPRAAVPSLQDEAVYRRYLDFGSLVNGGRVVANWLPDGSSFWCTRGDPNERQYIKVDPEADATTQLFDVRLLRTAFRETFGYEPAGAGVPFHRFQFIDDQTVRFALEGVTYQLGLADYSLSRVPQAPTSFVFETVRGEADRTLPRTFKRERFIGFGELPSPEAVSPGGQWIAGIEDKNLVLRATVDGQKLKATCDGTPEAFWDVEAELWDPWSPDGLRLALFKQHAEGVVRTPTIEWLGPRERVREVFIIPAGSRLYRSELYFFNLFSQTMEAVDLGDTANQYLRLLSWLPDASELILARYNRVFSQVDILSVNVSTRAVREVMTEHSETFLTNIHEAIWGADSGFTLLPDGSGFIWNSERNGWDHLYYYDMQGRLVRQLTNGDWRVKDVVSAAQVGGWVYFTGYGDRGRPYDLHLYRVRLDGEGFAQLTEGKGRHTISISPSAKYFTDTYSAVDVPPRTVLRRTDGTLISTLGESDISRLQAVGWVAPIEHVVKAADGATDLWVTMYLPYNFQPDRKYPVIEYIYAGPHSTARPLDFGDQLKCLWLSSGQENFNRALANLGFVVLILDARGTPERSKAFRDVVYMKWGQSEISDHAGAIRQLGARFGFLDLERVGVLGASWGGHFAFRAMTQAPDLYKVGISEVPGLDLRRGLAAEPYLGLPQDNKSGYDAAEVFALAPQLRGELLLIGGMNDTLTQADLFKLSEILIRLGKQHRTMIYPYSIHTPLEKTAEYDLELKKRFFWEHLMKIEGA
jgi:YD repeat-containing protein